MNTDNLKSHPRYPLVEGFDRFAAYTDAKIERGIEENRKGMFSLVFKDENGERIFPEKVTVRQLTHAFKFGCSLFHLGQFAEENRNREYEKRFKSLFNYGIVPIFWDTLEPERGAYRYSADSPHINRRPPIDSIRDFCHANNIGMKAHCLVYNSFNPDWLPQDNRLINIEIERRIMSLGERYKNDFEAIDVINEMFGIYKNCYAGNGMRNLQVTDEDDHEKYCFGLAKRYFPNTRLFWNEGCFETFGCPQYNGTRSRYYLMLKEQLAKGTPIQGIGMQYHVFTSKENELTAAAPFYNPLRVLDVLDRYSDFRLPIHISEVSIPSWSNEAGDEAIQAELVKRLYSLWFSAENVSSIVWWNLADGTAYGDENAFHAGLVRNDLTPKPAFAELDNLINHVWHTELTQTTDGPRFVFNGFYGDYEVAFSHGGKRYSGKVRLYPDTTGYDNRLSDWRVSTVRAVPTEA